jgi:adenylate cyclase
MSGQTPAVGMERKLAAIFSTDVAGYSRLMGDDEEATIRTLTAYRAVISSLIQQYRGRVIDAPGDNLLAEFASVVDAVRSAVEIQQKLRTKNAELPEHRRMQFRIGINLGDVIVEGERLYGDGVNIAARLESLAIPGGICISGTVHDQVETKLPLNYDYQGEQTVKNIAKPVRVYRVLLDATVVTLAEQLVLRQAQHERAPTPVTLSVSKGGQRGLQTRIVLLLAGLVLIAGTVIAVRYLSPHTSTQPPIPSTQAAPAALPLPDKPSIVVLPFVNMSKDPEQEYFSDGLTEVLTGDLSKISSLFVVARNTAFTYKGKAVDIQTLESELGVRYVLEGSVQKTDQQVRITAQLIEATTGFHLWAEQYNRPLKDIFTLQDEIVQKIVTTLKLRLTLREKGYLVRQTTDNWEAYDYYLRGLEQHSRVTKEANIQARQMFEKAIALDPQYAEAIVLAGWSYWAEWIYGWSRDPQTLERMVALARQALALDDGLPVTHSLLSWGYYFQRQYEQAVAEGERAIALDPNNTDSYANLASVMNFSGRPEDALPLMEKAMRLNPRCPEWYLLTLGIAYCFTGQYPEAITTLSEAVSRNPNDLGPHFYLALSYWGQWVSQQSADAQTLTQASVAAQRVLVITDTTFWGHALLGFVYLFQEQYEQALAEMERAIALDPNEAWSHAALAEVLSRVGRQEDALVAAEKALHMKPLMMDMHLANVGAAYAVAGRPKEAIAPLKQYLTHYPNILGAHLTLTAVYSELGQAAEARAEAAEVLRINPKFSLEVHKQRMPIRDPVTLERHIAALRKAGLK